MPKWTLMETSDTPVIEQRKLRTDLYGVLGMDVEEERINSTNNKDCVNIHCATPGETIEIENQKRETTDLKPLIHLSTYSNTHDGVTPPKETQESHSTTRMTTRSQTAIRRKNEDKRTINVSKTTSDLKKGGEERERQQNGILKWRPIKTTVTKQRGSCADSRNLLTIGVREMKMIPTSDWSCTYADPPTPGRTNETMETKNRKMGTMTLRSTPHCPTDPTRHNDIASLNEMRDTDTHSSPATEVTTRPQKVISWKYENEGTAGGLRATPDLVGGERGGCRSSGIFKWGSAETSVELMTEQWRTRADMCTVLGVGMKDGRRSPISDRRSTNIKMKGDDTLDNESRDRIPRVKLQRRENADNCNTHQRNGGGARPKECRKKCQLESKECTLTRKNRGPSPDLQMQVMGEVNSSTHMNKRCRNKLTVIADDAKIDQLGPVTRSKSRVQTQLHL